MKEKVLIIDDINLNISILTNILEDSGFTVFSTTNSLSVLEMTRKIKPDIILLDIMMPDLDGFEVCKLLKNDFYAKDILVIMVTAKKDGYDIKNALELGAFDYIKKPLDEIELIARIQSALRIKVEQDKLKDLAMKDSLTGLFSNYSFIELFEKELARQQRYNFNLSFVMIDIDYFKNVNDTYGHIAGNIILKELSNILVNSVRQGDIVSRYGGEEFCIVLPGADKDGAFQLCERIRQKIENFKFDIGSKTINATVSMGIFVKDSKDKIATSEIIHKADKELYRAKSNGRNRVEMYLN